ncbi:hypothetical protein SUGI_0259540 [Cryptomeria japonica]|nr:hypothetical protein SUGI_0259540 [Cryptomeria japonica]
MCQPMSLQVIASREEFAGIVQSHFFVALFLRPLLSLELSNLYHPFMTAFYGRSSGPQVSSRAISEGSWQTRL